ncbi:hypothetical protein, partial [Actinoplanes sp. NPDC051411]|uniref:hypothetical protein n=1 Tax=Actinoplanes sp. NPDC051411 TaxID=3155522 RepID=UPI003445635B
SRSTKVNMLRTAGILSHRPAKIKCYDRLNSPGPGAGALRTRPFRYRSVVVRPIFGLARFVAVNGGLELDLDLTHFS